jgi:hypothetical protein
MAHRMSILNKSLRHKLTLSSIFFFFFKKQNKIDTICLVRRHKVLFPNLINGPNQPDLLTGLFFFLIN